MASGIEASIASLSMNMAQSNVKSQASVRMLSKVLDATEQNAANMINQLSKAVPPANINSLGGLLDISV